MIELVGKKIEITSSGNKTLIGVKGTILKETKNTIIIKTKKTMKIVKHTITFKIDGKEHQGKKFIGNAMERAQS